MISELEKPVQIPSSNPVEPSLLELHEFEATEKINANKVQ
jgi:hypothetical protein